MPDIGDPGRRLRLAVAGAVGGVAAAVAAVWIIPPALHPADQAEARAALQAGLLTMAAAVAAVAGGLVALAETRRANERTHVRELYTRAVDQLGSANDTVRLGGIYALERIARDSPADQRTVVEVLSAFARGCGTDPGTPPAAGAVSQARPAPDVRAAVQVLARLPVRPGLRCADLASARFTGHTGLNALDLGGANLAHTDLQGADLSKSDLRGADLRHVDLRGANLTRTDLSGAVLSHADLRGTTCTDADLAAASLPGANLFGADLTGADLRGADLTRTRLTETTLAGADLSGADLADGEGLVQRQLGAARGDRRTRLPAGLEQPASWTD